jgi:polyisoprenoid-binding protein YceI
MRTQNFSKWLLTIVFIFSGISLFAQERLVASDTHIRFFSTTPAEDIESNNFASTGTLNPETGEFAFSVPMQSFEFEKSLMQKHFNQKRFLHTSEYPISNLTAVVKNFDRVDLSQNGDYEVEVAGEMTIRGETNPFSESGTLTVKDGLIVANSIFFITLADYGITFSRGKPSSNIANKVEVTVIAEFER